MDCWEPQLTATQPTHTSRLPLQKAYDFEHYAAVIGKNGENSKQNEAIKAALTLMRNLLLDAQVS